jgi:hypothetical protein
MEVTGVSNYNTSETGWGLTDTVAWLYWNFSEGTLENYERNETRQKDLQKLIWSELGQTTDPEYSHYFNNIRDLDQVDIWRNQAADALATGWTNNGRVQIVQLGDYQDVLIAGTGSPVPEPTTLTLLGFGLLGLAAVGRKKAKQQ